MTGNRKSGLVSPKAAHPPASRSRFALREAFRAGCGGQATIEYAVVTGILVALAAIMSLLLTTFSGYGERILEMIASDYP